MSKLRLQADELQRRLVQGVALMEQDADVLATQVDAAQQAVQSAAIVTGGWVFFVTHSHCMASGTKCVLMFTIHLVLTGAEDAEDAEDGVATATETAAPAVDPVAPVNPTTTSAALADVRAALRAFVREGKAIDQLVQRTARSLAALGGIRTRWQCRTLQHGTRTIAPKKSSVKS